MANVINVKAACLWRMGGYHNLQDWLNADAKHVYIGRDMTKYVPGAHRSKWANPFPLSQYTRDTCLQMYEEHVRHSYKLWNDLPELEGCVLGCWCAPASCHGHVLQKLISERRAALQ